jgi:flagellar motor switch protein FliG
MLDEQDIQKLIKVFATREEVPTKNEMEAFKLEMREEFSDLQTAVDKYAKNADTYFQEMLAMNSRINRLERWVQEIAKKMDLELTS